jgi:hypothetical protein
MVERSGGTAGLFARMRVDGSGTVTVCRPPGGEMTLQLDDRQMANLRSLLAGAHFGALSASYFLPRPVIPNGFAWRISHDGVTVATRDGEAPRGLGALMRELATILDATVFADDEGALA